MKFKCPVCKTIIEFNETGHKKIICGNCETSFNKSKIQELFEQYQQSRSDVNVGEPDRRQPIIKPKVGLGAKNSRTERSAPGIRAEKKDSNEIEIATPISAHSATLTKQRKHKSKRKLFILAGLAVLAIGIGTYLVFVLQHSETNKNDNDALDPVAKKTIDDKSKTEEHENPSETDHSTDRDIDSSAQEKPDRSGDPAESDEMPVSPRIPFFQLDAVDDDYSPPRNQIIASKTLKKCWFLAKPYLVELHAETPTGPRFCTGTIVDSRGWVLTSYRAIEGATTIHIRKARQSADVGADAVANQEVDQIRGIVSVLPEYDLVLLAVNRRLVNTFEDLPFASEDRIVPSQYVVACVPPTMAYTHSAIETRISERSKLENLNEPVSSLIQKLGFNDEIRWLIHEHHSPLSVGAPLLNEDGVVVGINVGVQPNSTNSFAVPAIHVAKILELKNDQVKPLSFATTSTIDDSGETAHRDSMKVVDSNSSLRELSENLNRLGTECDLIDWWPETPPQDEQFRQFLQYYGEAVRRLHSDATTNNDVQTLSEQVNSWTEKLENSLGVNSQLQLNSHKKFNQKFSDITQGPDQPFAGFVYVRYSAMESPKIAVDQNDPPSDSVVFEFKGTDDKIIANLQNDWPPLPPDSPWFVIGESVGQVRLNGRDQKRETIGMSKVHAVIQAN